MSVRGSHTLGLRMGNARRAASGCISDSLLQRRQKVHSRRAKKMVGAANPEYGHPEYRASSPVPKSPHATDGGDVSHALFELFRNPGIVGFEYEYSHLRPLVRRQRFNLFNDLECVHILNFRQKSGSSKPQALRAHEYPE